MSSHCGVMPSPCFLLTPSAVKITNWGFHELHYPSVALKAFEQSAYGELCFPAWVRRMLSHCPMSGQCCNPRAKGKLFFNYFFLQCLRPIDFSVEASFLVPRSCIAKRVERSHIAWEKGGRPANCSAVLKKMIWFMYTSFNVCAS